MALIPAISKIRSRIRPEKGHTDLILLLNSSDVYQTVKPLGLCPTWFAIFILNQQISEKCKFLRSENHFLGRLAFLVHDANSNVS